MSLNYDEVYRASTTANTVVYCSNLKADVTDNQIRETFGIHGRITDLRRFNDKEFAFIQFESHAAATTVIVKMNGAQLGGSTLRCWWGKEPETAAAISSQYEPSYQPAEYQPAAYQPAYVPPTYDMSAYLQSGYPQYDYQQTSKVTYEELVASLTHESVMSKVFDPRNTDVYCVDLPTDVTESQVREAFAKHGTIVALLLDKDKNVAFIKYTSQLEAATAIVEMNGAMMGGSSLKCWWGMQQAELFLRILGREPPPMMEFAGMLPDATYGYMRGFQQGGYPGQGGYPQQGGYPEPGGYPGY